jgi:hypothetical protein
MKKNPILRTKDLQILNSNNITLPMNNLTLPPTPSLKANYPLYINIIIVQIIRRFLTSFGMTAHRLINGEEAAICNRIIHNRKNLIYANRRFFPN